MKKLILTFLSILTLLSCTSPEDTKAPLFDPRIPGGNIGGNGSILSVSNVAVDTTIPGKIVVSWINPALYLFTDFKVHLYRRPCYSESDTCVISPPATGASDVFEVYNGQDSSFSDTSGILTGQNYTYWLYIEKSSVFGDGVKIGATTPIPQSVISLTDPATFWQRTGIGFGSFVTPNTPFSAYTLNPGLSSSVNPQRNTGKMAFAKSGAVLYVADTDNNRIVVLAKQGALSCDSITNKSSDAYKVCVYQYATEPYVPVNVIGQPNQYASKSCQDHLSDSTVYYSNIKFVANDSDTNLPKYDRCLTKPTGVWVDNDNLIIADSGNDRVVVHKGLPVKNACDQNMTPGQTTAQNCSADLVIGKKGFTDLSSYSVSTDGESALKNPTDVLVKDSDLYILDSGNHRVVKASNYSDTTYFKCFASSWKQSLCSFSAVLGQRGFREAKTLSSEIAASNLSFSGNTLSDPYFLAKHFENPTSMALSSAGQLLISSYENVSGTDSVTGRPMELRSRILVFDISIMSGTSPSCNIASFSGFACNASKVFGQATFDKIPVWSSGSGSFESQVSYGLLYVSGMTLAGNTLFVVQPDSNKIKVWSTWSTVTAAGIPYDFDIENPGGSPNPNDPSVNLPNLSNITAIGFDAISSKFYISDTGNKLIYEITGFQ